MDVKPDILKQSIESLLKLQDIDGAIFQLNSEIENVPAEIQAVQKKIQDADRDLKAAERVFRDVDRERRALELKSMTLSEDIKRAETKQREVRNTKEEFSAGKELDNFRKRLQEIKTALDEKATIAQQKATVRDEKTGAMRSLQDELAKLEEARAQRLEGVRTQLADIQSKRETYINRVDETIFSLYERIQRLRKGSGIALVKDDICQGCFVSIPPHTRLQLSRLEALITCSSCSRILYPAELAQDSAAQQKLSQSA